MDKSTFHAEDQQNKLVYDEKRFLPSLQDNRVPSVVVARTTPKTEMPTFRNLVRQERGNGKILSILNMEQMESHMGAQREMVMALQEYK